MSQLNIENLIRYNLVGTGEGRTAPCKLTELSGASPLMYDLLEQTTHIPFLNLRQCLDLWDGGGIINGTKPHELFLRQPIFIGSFSPFIQDSLQERFTRAISEIMNPNVPFNPNEPMNRSALESGFRSAVTMRDLFEKKRKLNDSEVTFGLILPDNIRYAAGEHATIEVPIIDEVLRAHIWIPPQMSDLIQSETTKVDRDKVERSYWSFAAHVRPLCSSRIYTAYQTALAKPL